MLIENLLKQKKNKSDVDKLKCSFEQKKMLENKPHLLKKALDSQRLYNRGFLYVVLSIIFIIALGVIDKTNDSNYLNTISLSLLTVIVVPTTFSVLSNAFALMLEIDNETIYKEINKDD